MAKRPTKELTKAEKSKFNLLFLDSINSMNSEDFEDAILYFDQMLEIDPESSIAFANRGVAKARLSRYEEAISDLDKAIEIDPNKENNWFSRGKAKFYLKRYGDALQDFDVAIHKDMDSFDLWNTYGLVLGKLGRHQEALNNLNKALESDKNNAELYYNIGVAKSELEQYENAIRDFEKAVELKEDYALAWQNLGATKSKLNRDEEAIKDINKAIELDKNFTHAFLNRGKIKSKIGHHQDALVDFEEALRLDPENLEIPYEISACKVQIQLQKLLNRKVDEINEDFEKKFINFGGLINEIKNEKNTAIENYKSRIKTRNLIVKTLIVFVALFSFAYVIFLLMNFTELDKEKIFYLYTLWPTTTITISIPLLIFLKLISRDAEELKILHQDYIRMLAIETRIDVYQKDLDQEKRNELLQKQLENWMHNSPTATLMKLKKRHADKSASHPIEEIIEKCIERCKQAMGKDTGKGGNKPNTP